MDRTQKNSIVVNDADLFNFPTSPVLAAAKSANTASNTTGPLILIDTTISYFSGISAAIKGGAIAASRQSFGLQNFADDTLWVPGGAQKPNQVSLGVNGGQALRMGFGGNLTADANNGYLTQAQNGQFGMNGVYTFGFVVRRPASGEVGGANPGAGPILGANNPGAPFNGIILNYYTGMSVYHNGAPICGISTGETVGTSIAYLVSYDSAAKTLNIWQNGTYIGTSTGVASNWNGGNLLLIGAAIFSGGAYYSQIDIAGVALWPIQTFTVGSTQAAAANAWLNQCRGNVT